MNPRITACFALAFGGVVLSACYTLPGALHPINNNGFKGQVEALAPVGTTEANAIIAMEAHGYRCTVNPNGSGFPGTRGGPQRVVVCTSHGHIPGQFFDRDWIVNFLIENDRVSEIAAVTDLNAL